MECSYPFAASQASDRNEAGQRHKYRDYFQIRQKRLVPIGKNILIRTGRGSAKKKKKLWGGGLDGAEKKLTTGTGRGSMLQAPLDPRDIE